MKCPKCGYVSHDYLDACRKCSADWVAFKQEIHLEVLEPGDLDLSLAAGRDVENFDATGEFSVEASFLSTRTLLVDREEVAEDADDDFDIELTDDASSDEFTEEFSGATQDVGGTADDAELEGSDFVMISEDDEEEAFIDLGAVEELETVDTAPAFAESFMEDTAHPPVDMIDMSDLEELDGDSLDTFEETVSDLGESTLDQDASSEVELAPAPEIEDVSEPDAAQGDPDGVPALNETVQLTLPEMSDEPPATAPPEVVPDLASDELLEAELELESEEPGVKPPSAEGHPADTGPEVVLDVEDLELEEDDKKSR